MSPRVAGIYYIRCSDGCLVNELVHLVTEWTDNLPKSTTTITAWESHQWHGQEHGLRRPCHACSVHLVVWLPLSSRNRRFFSEIWLLAINMALLLLSNSHDTTQHFTKHAWRTWHINLGESYHLIQHLETIWASYQSTQSNNPVNGWVSRGGMRNLGVL